MKTEQAPYQLLDFGHGRKLERFMDIILDRPSPPAEGFSYSSHKMWGLAHARFNREQGLSGRWTVRTDLPESWLFSYGTFSLLLKPTEVGHLGIFPEQMSNWNWLETQIRHALEKKLRPLRILNLFAYTGGSTLAAAGALKSLLPAPLLSACSVAHVDSAKNVVQWARQNAEISGFQDVPIRWLTEDALKFTRREVQRGHRYDAIILDPPSYGHGPNKQVWHIDVHLPELLKLCAELVSGEPDFLLLTSHSSEYNHQCLGQLLEITFPHQKIKTDSMKLKSSAGELLPAGDAAFIGTF